jgi:ribose transport system permease protein
MALLAIPTTKAGTRYSLSLTAAGPFLALAVLVILGVLVNPDFLALENVLNVVTRSSFIAIIAVGATFVISSGSLDLSVGSMSAFAAGIMIMFMNILVGDLGKGAIWAGIGAVVITGALCGLLNGVIVTFGKIESFIVTLGTMGIFRALITYMTNGGTIPIDRSLRDAYRPVYFGTVAGIPVPILVSAAVAIVGAFVLYKTKFGRRCAAVGANEEVARYSGISIRAVRIAAFVIQGLCVGIAIICYVPRLGAATPTTGFLWELQVITAVVIGGTPLRGGSGRIWGTVCGAVILETIGNLMVLSDVVSEYLVAAVQGIIIIIAMLIQRVSK